MGKSLLYAILLMMLPWLTANAETVSPYNVDFNNDTRTSTLDHDFKVAPGWDHIVDSYYNYIDTYYVSYYMSTQGSFGGGKGVDGSNCLSVGSQEIGRGLDTKEAHDLLVTPKLKGKVTFKVKATSSSKSKVEVYNVSYDGGKATMGTQITTAVIPELSTNDYVTVEVDNVDGYLGLYLSDLYFDDFSAESAEVELHSALSITNFSLSSDNTVYTADASGNAKIEYTATVKNTGEKDLKAGDKGYELTIRNRADSSIVATQPISQDLAVGATSEPILITATVPVTANTTASFDLYEGLSGNSAKGPEITLKGNYPELSVNEAGKTTALTNKDAQDFGSARQDVSKQYDIHNVGAAAMTVSSITATDGFTVSGITLPATIAAGDSVVITVTMKAGTPGKKQATLAITTDGGSLSLPLRGRIIDPQQWSEDFENGTIPAYLDNEDNSWKASQTSYITSNYAAFQNSYSEKKLVSPLLEVKSGDELEFDLTTNSSYSSASMRISYSKDKQTWKQIQYISSSNLSTSEKHFTVALPDEAVGDVYIAFGGSSRIYLDNILGPKVKDIAHELAIKSSSLPKAGTTNNQFSSTVTIENRNVKADDGSYIVNLYLDDNKIASAEGKAIAVGDSVKFELPYTPHITGTHNLKLAVEFSDGTEALEVEGNINIVQEVSSADVTVGTASGSSNNVPVKSSYTNSESEAVYTADELGLPANCKITKIVYRGAYTGNKTNKVSVWIGKTDKTASSKTDHADKSTMTQVLSDGSVVAAGTTSGSSWNPSIATAGDILTVDMSSNPYVYTGGNLEIVVSTTNFVYDSSHPAIFETDQSKKDRCVYRYKDGELTSSTSYYTTYLPVLHITYALESPVVSGQLTDAVDGSPIDNGTVKLTSGDVIYQGTTDAEGKYSIEVIQKDKAYSLEASAEGYETATEDGLTFAANTTKDYSLNRAGVAVNITSAGWASFSSARNLDFSAVSGLKAYAATSATADGVTLTEVTNVPKNTGLLVSGNEGQYIVPLASASSDATSLLQATTAKTSLNEGDGYVFGTLNGRIGFVAVGSKGYTVDAGKAWLPASVIPAGAKSFLVISNDETTGINGVKTGLDSNDTNVYNIAGQRVNSTYKGLVIKDGKKFINK